MHTHMYRRDVQLSATEVLIAVTQTLLVCSICFTLVGIYLLATL